MTINKKCILEKDLSTETRREIIELKQKYWKHSFESQIKWMKEYLNDEDEHVLYYENDRLVAYLDLANIKFECDNRTFNAIGMGNVCVHPDLANRGYGTDIVRFASERIEQKNRLGVLLCHDELVDFYKKCNWIQINKNVSIVINENPFDLNLMINNQESIGSLDIKKISIDKNF